MSGNLFNSLFIPIAAVIILLISGFTFYRTIIQPFLPKGSNAVITLPEQLPAKGFKVPIVDAYGSIKDVDRATVTQNFQKPKLILFEDHLDYKLFFRRSAKYSDVLEVNSRSEFLQYFLQFTFKNRTLVLTVVMGDAKLHQQVIDFLSSKGVMVIE